MTILWPVAGGDQESRLVEARLPAAISFDRKRYVRWLKASQHLQQRDHVSAVSAQPARLPQRQAIQRGIQACPCNRCIERRASNLAFGFAQAAYLRLHDPSAHRWKIRPRTIRHEVQGFEGF